MGALRDQAEDNRRRSIVRFQLRADTDGNFRLMRSARWVARLRHWLRSRSFAWRRRITAGAMLQIDRTVIARTALCANGTAAHRPARCLAITGAIAYEGSSSVPGDAVASVAIRLAKTEFNPVTGAQALRGLPDFEQDRRSKVAGIVADAACRCGGLAVPCRSAAGARCGRPIRSPPRSASPIVSIRRENMRSHPPVERRLVDGFRRRRARGCAGDERPWGNAPIPAYGDPPSGPATGPPWPGLDACPLPLPLSYARR